jgi:GT2 family glycosyltransferase
MNTQPKISVIIINFNNPFDTQECIHSLMKNEFNSYELILVDNGSTDNSRERLKDLISKYSNLTFITNKNNLGFAGGNNDAVKSARGDYILLLNNDTIVKDDFLAGLMKQASENPDATIFCPKIFFYDRPDTIWFAGGYIDWKNEGAHIGYEKKDNHAYDTAVICAYVTGCAMLIKKEVINKIGLFDESFFAYQEDVDFCVRARKAGYKCMYIPYPHVWHKAGLTSKKQGRTSPFMRYLGTRNKLTVVRKNYGKLRFVEALLRELFVMTPICILLYSSRGHFDLIPAQLQGIIDGIRGKNKYL